MKPKDMPGKSVLMFAHHRESRQKYDYFVLGVSTALFGYIGESFIPEKLSFSRNTIELMSLCFLAGSFVSGMMRIERNVQVEGYNFKRLQLQENKSEIIKAANEPGSVFNTNTGLDFDPDTASQELRLIVKWLEDIDEKVLQLSKSTERYFNLRKWSLLGGVALLIVAKLLGPYLPTFQIWLSNISF